MFGLLDMTDTHRDRSCTNFSFKRKVYVGIRRYLRLIRVTLALGLDCRHHTSIRIVLRSKPDHEERLWEFWLLENDATPIRLRHVRL